MAVLDSLSFIGVRGKDLVALFWRSWAWTKLIFFRLIPFGDAWGYLVIFARAVFSFAVERKLDLIKAWTLVRKSYDMGELSNSIWDEVDLSVVLTVLGTLFLFLLLLTRGGRNLILGAIDTAVASALLVLIGALVFAVPILVLIGILSALVTTLTWLACFVWHVVESPVLFFFQRTSGGEGLETGGPAGGEPVVSHTVIPDAEVVGQ